MVEGSGTSSSLAAAAADKQDLITVQAPGEVSAVKPSGEVTGAQAPAVTTSAEAQAPTPAIQVAGKGMSVESMKQVATGEVPDAADPNNRILSASENVSNDTLAQQAQETLPSTVVENVAALATSVEAFLGDGPITPESATEAMVQAQAAATGEPRAQAAKKVAEKQLSWRGKVGIATLKKLESLPKGSRMSSFIDNFLRPTEGSSSVDTIGSWGDETETGEPVFSLVEFQSTMKDNPKKLADALLKAGVTDGEKVGFFDKLDPATRTDIISKLKTTDAEKLPAILFEALNLVVDLIFDPTDEAQRVANWQLVRLRLGNELTGEKKLKLAPEIRKFFMENYNEQDPDRKTLKNYLPKFSTSAAAPTVTTSAAA